MKNLIAFFLLVALAEGAAKGQPHVMSLTTIADSKFDKYIVLKASRNNTPVQIDYGDGNPVNIIVGTQQSWFLNPVPGSGYAKIYGDSIISLWAQGEVTSLDVSGNPDLLDLNCAGGKLTELDLTKNEALESVDCSWNALTAIDLSQNHALKSFNCSRNKLSEIDLTAQPGLGYLECGFNQLKEVDVTGLPILHGLNCEGNPISVLDLSQNPELTGLRCSSCSIKSLNLIGNPELTNLSCNSNGLHTLNLTVQTNLVYLDCHDNLLTKLDVQRNPKLRLLFCSDNLLDFSTLPLQQPKFQIYNYAPQRPIPMTGDADMGDIIDLGSLFKPGFAVSDFVWKLKGGMPLVENLDYVCTGGKTVFFRLPGDSVYCEIVNRQFGDLCGTNALKTELIRIDESRASVVMLTEKSAGDTITMRLRADTPATMIQLDFGNGQREDVLLDTIDLTLSHPITGSGQLKISGGHLTVLDLRNNKLTCLFVDPELPLKEFNCADNLLTSLYANPNAAFQNFSCSNNHLDFSSLPIPQPAWMHYEYAPQRPLYIVSDTSEGSETDLSDQYLVNDQQTSFSWKRKNGTDLLEQADYVIANGITTFVSDPEDSVYCSMTNPIFPALASDEVLKTCRISIHPVEPQMSFHINFYICDRCHTYSVSYYLAASTDSIPVLIKYGDNPPVEQTIGKGEQRIDFSSTFKPDIKVVLFGRGISTFRSSTTTITGIDVTRNPYLRKLCISGNSTSFIDLHRNRLLTWLVIPSNGLNALNLQSNNLLERLDCSNNHLEDIELGNNPGLRFLNCSSNPLKYIILNWNEQLDSLTCMGNDLTTINISMNRRLLYLNCSTNKLKALDVSKHPSLMTLKCNGNLIGSLALEYNRNLSVLECDQNQLTKLELTENPRLSVLKCRQNVISTLNLDANSLLKTLYCESNTLNELDIGKCDSLQLVEGGFNKIESLDLSRLYALTSLNVVENNLTELDISHNTKLKNCWYYGNRLTFATIPPPWPTWEWFVYAPQQPVFIKPSIAIDDSIDLSDQFKIGSDTTLFVWKDASGTPLLEGTDYLIQHGVTHFLHVQPDSVFCEMSNSLLPQFTGKDLLKTTRTLVSIPSRINATEHAGLQILYSHGRCFLDAPFAGTYRLFDMTGRLVATGSVQPGLNEISYPQTGVYLVTVSDTTSGMVGKIVL